MRAATARRGRQQRGKVLGLTGRRHPGRAVQTTQGIVERQVARWPDVGASQRHQQVDAGSPGPDSSDPHQVLTCLAVGVPPQAIQCQLSPEHLLRETTGVARLLPGESEPLKSGRPQSQDARRIDLFHCSDETMVERLRRGERDLLLLDDSKQAGKPRAACPQWWGPMAGHEAGQPSVASGENPHC